jgi:glycosyltransferase involved in cell wall biosynthesis
MTATAKSGRLDLAVVMPVYNEAECIADVIGSWLRVLEAESLRFSLIVLNDGSCDATADALERFANDSRVDLIHKQNSGHGPTILLGYRRAVGIADWVFQVDSDDELAATEFPAMWRARPRYDAVIGVRYGRRQPVGRWIITRLSRALVRLWYGGTVKDVNVPFRLMRADVLSSFVTRIPGDTFAPNVVISGVLAGSQYRVANVPVAHRDRRTGEVSIMRWKLWKGALRSAAQTIRCRSLVGIRRPSQAANGKPADECLDVVER